MYIDGPFCGFLVSFLCSDIRVVHPLAELYKMVCERNETDLDIGIPAVLLPKDAGSSLQSLLSSGEGKFLSSVI